MVMSTYSIHLKLLIAFLCSTIYSYVLVYSIEFYIQSKTHDKNYNTLKLISLVSFISMISLFNNFLIFKLSMLTNKRCYCDNQKID